MEYINGLLLVVILGVVLYEFRTHHDTRSLRTRAARAMARADSLDAMREQRDRSERQYSADLQLRYDHVANRLFRNAPRIEESNA